MLIVSMDGTLKIEIYNLLGTVRCRSILGSFCTVVKTEVPHTVTYSGISKHECYCEAKYAWKIWGRG
jgi:hypothetical protein